MLRNMTTTEEGKEELWQWCHTIGIAVDGLALGAAHGRSLMASKEFEAGSELLVVPKAAFLRPPAATPADKEKMINNQSRLSLYILSELNGESTLKPYLNLLPRSFKHMPELWSPDKLGLLKDTMAAAEVEGRRQEILAQFNRLAGCTSYSFEQFTWARLVVMTRIFALPEGQEAIVPIVDMINHSTRPNCDAFYDSKREAFVVKACQRINKAEEITISYGQKPNSRLLASYGFALEDNPADEVPILVKGKFIRLGYAGHRGWSMANEFNDDDIAEASKQAWPVDTLCRDLHALATAKNNKTRYALICRIGEGRVHQFLRSAKRRVTSTAGDLKTLGKE